MPGYQSPDWGNLQRQYESQQQKQQAMQRFMALLDHQMAQRRAAETQGRRWDPNSLMRSAFALGGEYEGLYSAKLGRGSFLYPRSRDNAPYSRKGEPGYLTEPVRVRRQQGGPDPSLLDLFTRDAPRGR